MKPIIAFIKKETVLCVAALLALISMFVVPPCAAYADYIDYRVLALLFCLMLVVAALRSINVFDILGRQLLKYACTARRLSALLVYLCFFSSMLITNDVSLITFVPFAVMMMSAAGREDLLIPVIVLQTIAANLGSMLTPIGNPQNLYLYTLFHIPMGQFLKLMLPLTAASGLLLGCALMMIKNSPLDVAQSLYRVQPAKEYTSASVSSFPAVRSFRVRLFIYIALFIVCLSCVLRLLPYPAMLIVVCLTVFFTDVRLFAGADYFLLLTFVCFFVFIGNMENYPVVAKLLGSAIDNRELLLGTALSQIISNVPAAVLLSGFTSRYPALLYGVNIGGLGTLIASLASLISYRCYAAAAGAKKSRYMLVFTVYNLLFLIVLYSLAAILIHYAGV